MKIEYTGVCTLAVCPCVIPRAYAGVGAVSSQLASSCVQAWIAHAYVSCNGRYSYNVYIAYLLVPIACGRVPLWWECSTVEVKTPVGSRHQVIYGPWTHATQRI